MLSGCVLSLSSIYLFGLDGQIVSPAVFPNICQIKTWVLSIGFTLGYGAMYSKVWRVHRLHTSQKKNAIRVNDNEMGPFGTLAFIGQLEFVWFQKALQPWKMYSIVIFLLAVDITILFLWQCMDPLDRSIQVFPLENPLNSNDDVKIRPELEHCKSENHNFWLSKFNWSIVTFSGTRRTLAVPKLFGFCRFDFELQRVAFAIRSVRFVRNPKRQVEANKRFSLRRHVNLQRGGHLFDNSTGDNSHCVAARRLFCFYIIVGDFLLFSLDGSDFRAKSKILILSV